MANNSSNGTAENVVAILIVLGLVYALSLWTQHSANFWLEAMGKADLSIWKATLISVVFSPLSVVFNIITEIVRF